jgi:hypothetical protein
MSAEIINTYTNEVDGISAIVNVMSKGYSVAMRDDDSGMYLDSIRIFSDVNHARDYAQFLINKVD